LFELFEPIGHAGGDNGIGEEGLRITGRYELDVSVAAESRDGVERPSFPPARPESKRSIQFLATGVGAPFSRQESVRVLTRRVEILGELRDCQALRAQQCLPDFGILGHGDECNSPWSKAGWRHTRPG